MGEGKDWEATSEGGGISDSLGKVLLPGISGGTLVCSGDMGAYGDNDSAVRGRACEFFETGHM